MVSCEALTMNFVSLETCPLFSMKLKGSLCIATRIDSLSIAEVLFRVLFNSMLFVALAGWKE
ncbi:Uncharacterised protein [uncultured archaeon]|nr:Uncharacterised protein [uncultured archaeon]